MSSLLCPICNAKIPLTKTVEKIKTEKRFSYIICPNCSHGNLFPLPKEKELKNIYDTTEYFINLSAPVKNPIKQWIITRRIYATPAEWVAKKFKKGEILDVGCGNGEFLYELKNKGWKVWGTDISKFAVINTGKKIGKGRVKNGNFLKLKYDKVFDIVSFWHILEHVDNPVDYMGKANSLLKKGGKIVGEMPNFDSAALRKFQNNYSWFIVPDHIMYFSKQSLAHALKKSGFQRITIYSPSRALLNYSLSYYNMLNKKNYPFLVKKGLFIFSIPISVISCVISSKIVKGEVIRFIAYK